MRPEKVPSSTSMAGKAALGSRRVPSPPYISVSTTADRTFDEATRGVTVRPMSGLSRAVTPALTLFTSKAVTAYT
jgi:hypothetical protein